MPSFVYTFLHSVHIDKSHFKMRSFQTALVVRLFNNTIMDPDTFNLIQKLCTKFQLPPDIEFTCYEAYEEYFKRYFCDLEKRFKQTTLEYNGVMKQKSHLIDRVLDEVGKTSLLHILALISICAKYVNGFRCEKLFTKLSKYLQRNGTPYSVPEIRNTEYIVFKFLEFSVSGKKIWINKLFRLCIEFDFGFLFWFKIDQTIGTVRFGLWIGNKNYKSQSWNHPIWPSTWWMCVGAPFDLSLSQKIRWNVSAVNTCAQIEMLMLMNNVRYYLQPSLRWTKLLRIRWKWKNQIGSGHSLCINVAHQTTERECDS